MKFFCLLAFLFFFVLGKAAVVDTVSIYSKSMNRSMNCVVIKPGAYKKRSNRFPTVYLLHGFSGDFSNWIKKVPQLKEYADQYQVILVCPDGGYSSWYFDSPVDPSMKYETYVASEVPAFIDSAYRTIKSRWARAITGLSMGGHGALFLAFRHADFFGACGSMSGGMNLSSSKNKFDIIKRIGDTIAYAANWKTYSVVNVIDKYPKDSLAITFDCGVDDFFYPDNRELHEKMLRLKIPHDYSERPGKHSWDYWANSIQYHLLFFRNYFNRQATK
jgi:S-formylglutathione hydrolase FrmB